MQYHTELGKEKLVSECTCTLKSFKDRVEMTSCTYKSICLLSVVGDHVEVTLSDHALIRWQLSPHTWELLWDLRTSLQAMIQRKLRPNELKSNSTANNWKDSQLLSLLVDLLNNTDLDATIDDDGSHAAGPFLQ